MQLFAKRDDAVVVVQHQALHKLVANGILQLAQATQVGAAHGGGCLDLDSDDAAFCDWGADSWAMS